MCVSPIKIPNPNLGLKAVGLNRLKDCTSPFILVPCGYCKSCVRRRTNNLVQRSLMESLESYLYMITLTYNNEMIPTITTSDGFDIKYASFEDIKKMFKRIRKYNLIDRPFKYFCVYEMGSLKGRPHFHILLSLKKYDSDDLYTPLNYEFNFYNLFLNEWKRNVSKSTKFPVYKPLFTFKKRVFNGRVFSNYDCHLLKNKFGEDASSSVTAYVTKYMLKPSDRESKLKTALSLNISPEEFHEIWSLVKPRYTKSLNYGINESSIKYLRDCVVRSRGSCDYPSFFNPISGESLPLAKFYKNDSRIFTLEDALYWHDKNSESSEDVFFDSIDTNSAYAIKSAEFNVDISKYIDQDKDFLDFVDF